MAFPGVILECFELLLEIGKAQIFSVGFQIFYRREKLIGKFNGST